MGDLWALYHFDIKMIREGTDRVLLCSALLARLCEDAHSHWRAEQIGGSEHLDFGVLSHQIAALTDAVQWNTSVTAAHGGKRRPRKPASSYRPTVRRKQAKTLMDVDWSFFR